MQRAAALCLIQLMYRVCFSSVVAGPNSALVLVFRVWLFFLSFFLGCCHANSVKSDPYKGRCGLWAREFIIVVVVVTHYDYNIEL